MSNIILWSMLVCSYFLPVLYQKIVDPFVFKYCFFLNLKMSQDKKTSNIWQHFSVIGSNFATCDICKKKLSYKTSTTNLRKHLNNIHLLYSFTSSTKVCITQFDYFLV